MTRFSLPPSRTNHLDGGGDHGSDKIRDKRNTSTHEGFGGMRNDLKIGPRTDWHIDLYQGARRLLVDT
jgi:hypothetical protein